MAADKKLAAAAVLSALEGIFTKTKSGTEYFLGFEDFLAVLSTGFGESSVKPCGASRVTTGRGHMPVVTPGTNKKQHAALNAIEDSSCLSSESVAYRSYCHRFVQIFVQKLEMSE